MVLLSGKKEGDAAIKKDVAAVTSPDRYKITYQKEWNNNILRRCWYILQKKSENLKCYFEISSLSLTFGCFFDIFFCKQIKPLLIWWHTRISPSKFKLNRMSKFWCPKIRQLNLSLWIFIDKLCSLDKINYS